MDSRTHLKALVLSFVSLAAAASLVVGCSGGSGSTAAPTTPATVTAPASVIGTDAPMASMVSFATQINGIDAVPSRGGTPVSLISGTPTVDFARFNGLQTLLDLNDVLGTHDSITITLGSATIGYLDTPASGAPTITMSTS